MREMTIKIFLMGLALFVCEVPTLAQNQDVDIRCEVLSADYNVLGSKTLSDFGSFYLFADGKEERGGTMVARFYKLPRTNLILSVLVGYNPKDDVVDNKSVIQRMILGKKKVPISSDAEYYKFFFDGFAKHAVNDVSVLYSIKAFDEGSKGVLSIQYLGKKEPIRIMMTCKKVKKARS